MDYTFNIGDRVVDLYASFASPGKIIDRDSTDDFYKIVTDKGSTIWRWASELRLETPAQDVPKAGDKVRVEWISPSYVGATATATESFVPESGTYVGFYNVKSGEATVTILERAKPKEPAPGQRVRVTFPEQGHTDFTSLREAVCVVSKYGSYFGYRDVENGKATVEILEEK